MTAPPTLTDVFAAKSTIHRYLAVTPLYHYPSLSELVGAEVYVKHENHQPTGSFKIRGQINVLSNLAPAARSRGVIMASTGNDAQALAYAAKLFDLNATVVMPRRSNRTKVRMTESFGAKVVFHGEGFEQSKDFAEKVAMRDNRTYIHSANDPNLIAGAATLMLEVVEQLPEAEEVIVPVGGGACASGVCLVAKWADRAIRVIGVQSAKAPAAYESWRSGSITSAPNRTFAEGLAVGSGYELPQRVMKKKLDDFVLVSDSEILASMGTMINETRNLVEPASAATLAAAMKRKKKRNLSGKKVVLVLTGGNASPEQLLMALDGRSRPALHDTAPRRPPAR